MILILDNSPKITGAFRSITSLVSSLPSEASVQFALNSPSLAKEVQKKGSKTHHIPFLEIQKNYRLTLYLPILLINTFRVLRIVKQEKHEVLHVNDLYNMIGVLVKIFKPSIKLVYHVRLLPSSYAAALYKFWANVITKFSDHVICVSQAVYDALPASPKKQIIYDAMLPVSNLEKQQNSKFIFLYVGNYIEGKGHNFAIEAFTSQKDELKEAQLIFVGGTMGQLKNTAYKNKLKSLVEDKGLSASIQFRDFTNDLSPVYQQAHVTLNFSESESFSMVCLESLMNGTPVIATKCGGPEEIIHHNQNGMLVGNRNIEEMGNAMVTIYQNQELRASMEKNTIPSTAKFSIEESSLKLAALYSS